MWPVDGVPQRPLTVSSIDIYPAQRYTVVVAADQPVGNYWIRAEAGEIGVPGHVRNNPNFDPDARAILRYEGAPDAEPGEDSRRVNEFGSLDIRDLSVFSLPDPRLQGDSPPDVRVELKFNQDRNEVTRAVQWRVNNIAVRYRGG
jgi:iron transport multicopper oxidase